LTLITALMIPETVSEYDGIKSDAHDVASVDRVLTNLFYIALSSSSLLLLLFLFASFNRSHRSTTDNRPNTVMHLFEYKLSERISDLGRPAYSPANSHQVYRRISLTNVPMV